MLRRIRERRHALLAVAAYSMGVAAFFGMAIALVAGVPLSGKAPPMSVILLRQLGMAVNIAAVVFWLAFPPLALVELFKREDATR